MLLAMVSPLLGVPKPVGWSQPEPAEKPLLPVVMSLKSPGLVVPSS